MKKPEYRSVIQNGMHPVGMVIDDEGNHKNLRRVCISFYDPPGSTLPWSPEPISLCIETGGQDGPSPQVTIRSRHSRERLLVLTDEQLDALEAIQNEEQLSQLMVKRFNFGSAS